MGTVKFFLFWAISFFCTTSCFALNASIDVGVPFNGFTKDTIYYDAVYFGGPYRGEYIVVEKGCATWFYEEKAGMTSLTGSFAS